MSPELATTLLRLGALLAAVASGTLLVQGLVRGAGAQTGAALDRYCAWLDGELRILFLPERARVIATSQLVAVIFALVIAIAFFSVLPLTALPLIALAPRITLAGMRARRTRAIDDKLDGFALTLANAMRATPSIGRALELVQKVLPAPLDQEVELVLREMRVGSSVEQSLLGMSARVKSSSLDAVLSGILIGRQVGGNLPEILETTSATLREMGRLEGVLRSKTAEGKAQVYVLAFFPIILGLGFNTASPGYFTSMTSTALGLTLFVAALAFWLGSILAARKILAVEL